MSLVPFPSMSHLRSCRGSPLDLDPAPDSYLGCDLFYIHLGSTLSPAQVPSMSHLRSCGGVNSGSRSSFRSISGLYLFDLNLGFNLGWTVSLASIPIYASPLDHCGGGHLLDLDPAPYWYLGCDFFLHYFRVYSVSGSGPILCLT